MDRYYQLTPSVFGGTEQTSPDSYPMPTEDAFLVDVEIVIPSGHVGLTGIRVLQSGQQILPWANLSWISGDNYSRVFQVNSEIGADSLSVQAYNEDFNNHVFYLRFHLRDLSDGTGGGMSSEQRAAQSLVGMSSASVT